MDHYDFNYYVGLSILRATQMLLTRVPWDYPDPPGSTPSTVVGRGIQLIFYFGDFFVLKETFVHM